MHNFSCARFASEYVGSTVCTLYTLELLCMLAGAPAHAGSLLSVTRHSNVREIPFLLDVPVYNNDFKIIG